MDSGIPTILCSQEQEEELRQIARSTTAGIWRIKRAKIILGTLEGRSVDRLVFDVRVPPLSIIKCQQHFAKEGMAYFSKPDRDPTAREAVIERLLAFLEHSPDRSDSDWDNLKHRYIGIYFSARQIQTIRDLIASNPQNARAKLAREICARYELYQPNGKMRYETVCDILKRMDMDNLITLPPLPQNKRAHRMRIGKPLAAPPETMEPAPHDTEALRFVVVRSQEDIRLWNAMIREHHYIKSSRLFGPQVRYLVYGSKKPDPQPVPENSAARKTGAPSDRDKPVCGVDPLFHGIRAFPDSDKSPNGILLAVLGFASSAWRLSSRDRFIGWNDEQRIANLRYVVSNARFLILPWIRCPNLASRILGGIVRRLPHDWEERYHYRPILLETFVQLDRFTGTCYKAANWIRLGTTDGYSLYGKKQKKQVPTKAVFVYPLTRKFREILCCASG